jgi:hypothetical protein
MELEILNEIENILNMEQNEIENLKKFVLNKNSHVMVRCAALDKYAEIKKAGAKGLLTQVANNYENPEDLRVVAHQWLRNPETEPRVRGAVRTRGAITTEKLPSMEDPSARVRWLEGLSD